ncbi:MAG: hypothetical protein U9Q73_03235 [Nanoarchaeota archaeon]|nr:hypothetical protein [Nanoarchaeota archaeon]
MGEQTIESVEINGKALFYILIISLLIISIIIFFTCFFISKSQSVSQSVSQSDQTTLLEEKLKECSTLTPSQECILLYSTPDIESKCNSLKELKDQCLYNFAIINERIDTCDTIQNTILKNKCQEEINYFFISEE